MVRVKLVFVLLFTAIVAVEPTLHHHSLIPRAGRNSWHAPNFCAACVAGSARIVSPAPVIAVPVVVAFTAAPEQPVARWADAFHLVPSRAPPAV
jgi:hypothetical protein